jgi:hypothetical protein
VTSSGGKSGVVFRRLNFVPVLWAIATLIWLRCVRRIGQELVVSILYFFISVVQYVTVSFLLFIFIFRMLYSSLRTHLSYQYSSGGGGGCAVRVVFLRSTFLPPWSTVSMIPTFRSYEDKLYGQLDVNIASGLLW